MSSRSCCLPKKRSKNGNAADAQHSPLFSPIQIFTMQILNSSSPWGGRWKINIDDCALAMPLEVSNHSIVQSPHGLLPSKLKSLKNSTFSLIPCPVISTDAPNNCEPLIASVVTPEYSVNCPTCPVRAKLPVVEKSILVLMVSGCETGNAYVAVREMGL